MLVGQLQRSLPPFVLTQAVQFMTARMASCFLFSQESNSGHKLNIRQTTVGSSSELSRASVDCRIHMLISHAGSLQKLMKCKNYKIK